jgi:hypothetical protein
MRHQVEYMIEFAEWLLALPPGALPAVAAPAVGQGGGLAWDLLLEAAAVLEEDDAAAGAGAAAEPPERAADPTPWGITNRGALLLLLLLPRRASRCPSRPTHRHYRGRWLPAAVGRRRQAQYARRCQGERLRSMQGVSRHQCACWVAAHALPLHARSQDGTRGIDQTGRNAHGAVVAAAGGGGIVSLGPKALRPAARLERLLRTHVLLGHAAHDGGATLAHWLQAQGCALRLLGGALAAAEQLRCGGGSRKNDDGINAPATEAAAGCRSPQPPAPATLAGWACWREDEATAAALAADAGPHALGRANIPRPEALAAALRLLADGLADAGHVWAALPVAQLRRLLCRCVHAPAAGGGGGPVGAAAGAAAEAAAAAQLAGLLETLELPAEAQHWVDVALAQAAAAAGACGPAGGADELRRMVRAALLQRPGGADGEVGGPPLPPHAAALVQEALAAAAPAARDAWRRELAEARRCAAAAAPPDAAAGEAARGPMLAAPALAPLAPHCALLEVAAHLAARGQSSAARELIERAEASAALAGDAQALAHAALAAARAALVDGGGGAAAARLAQRAQAAGGLGGRGWREAVEVYAAAREGMLGAGELDALNALEAGAAALEAAGAAGAAGLPAAAAAAARLRLRAAELLLRRGAREAAVFAAERAAGAGGGGEAARALEAAGAARARALALARHAAGDLGTCGNPAAPARLEALLLVSEALLAQPGLVGDATAAPAVDARTALLEVLRVLQVRLPPALLWDARG